MRLALLLVVLTLAACAVTAGAPPLVVPGGLPAEAEAVRVEGLGGARRGEVAFRGWEGRFERQFSTSRTNRWDQQRFDGSFRLAGDGGEAIGICAMREGLLEVPAPLLGTVQVPAISYVYDCELEADGRAGRLQIGEVVTSTYAPAGDRRGLAYLGDGPAIEVRSLHQLEGVPVRSTAPWGYGLFSEGRPVGVVDLTDARPVLRLPPEGSPAAETAELAALALAMLQTE